jgi:3-carboxy-cis,cis-muconate cycloisomerase
MAMRFSGSRQAEKKLPRMSNPFESFLSTPEAIDCFGAHSWVQAMLDVEAALSLSSAECGLIPKREAAVIADYCKAELLDVNAIIAESSNAGSPAIPLVKHLTQLISGVDPDASRYVHWGATSQDVIDTAMALVSKRSLAMIDGELGRICFALATLARAHRNTPVLARTLLQAAQVTSLGLKCANWLAPIARSRWGLRELAPHSLCLQLGGAVGTRLTLGSNADQIAATMAARLSLTNTKTPWHTQRDRWLRLGTEVGILCGSLGKIARDVALMSQSEVAEVSEASRAGRGGSSAMPHKRNSVGAMIALAAAQRAPHRVAALLSAMPQEHERGLGNWQAELAEWSGLFISAQGAASAMAVTFTSIQVDAARMQANIDAQRGLVFAESASNLIARVLGKVAAHQMVETASKRAVADDEHLRDVLQRMIEVDPKLAVSIDRQAFAEVFSSPAAASAACVYIDATFSEIESLKDATQCMNSKWV